MATGIGLAEEKNVKAENCICKGCGYCYIKKEGGCNKCGVALAICGSCTETFK